MNEQEVSKILNEYVRPIVHMRQQLNGRRFGLVFGSGISKKFLLPNWNELIERIAKNHEVNGQEIIRFKNDKSPQASLTQMLFEHFKAQKIDKLGLDSAALSKENEKIICQSWRYIIHKELWRNFRMKFLKKGYHPFLDSFVEIIKKSNLTINYNFDDTIQTLISLRRSEDEIRKGIKGYETVWDARLQFQSNRGIIYHPNGFLPLNLMEGASDNIIFSEDSFADQLIASMSGHYSTLLHHLSKNTCLFIGLSLEDNTLKHLLRQNSQINPGHYHYYVAYTKNRKHLNEEQEHAIRESNFELYNLITLFLDDEGIKTVGELLQLDEKGFDYYIKTNKLNKKFVYYITGAVGCGKTTTLSYFRNVSTFSEWPEKRHRLLAKPFDKLTKKELHSVDSWIGLMFHKKNVNLSNIEEGISVIDRSPLDPLTFTSSDEEMKNKAKFLHDNISKGGSYRIVPGMVILLKGDKEVIASRVRTRQKSKVLDYNSNYIEEMYKKFDDILGQIKGKIFIETNELSIHEVVKRVARIMHFEKYEEGDLHSILDKLIKG